MPTVEFCDLSIPSKAQRRKSAYDRSPAAVNLNRAAAFHGIYPSRRQVHPIVEHERDHRSGA